MVKDTGYRKCTHDGTGLPKEGSTGASTENDKKLSIKLVPAQIPTLLKRGGRPRSVKEARPRRSWLAEENSPDRCWNVRQ
jgi:hypothetical protein